MAEPKLTDALKKVFAVGVSGALLSEELIKNYLADAKLPKDILQALLQNAQKSKDEVTSRISAEAVKMLGKVDWAKAASRFLEDHKVTIKMELDFKKKEQSGSASESSTDS